MATSIETTRQHMALLNMLPVECRETVTDMACAAFDVAAVLAPNLGITTRMFESALAQVALRERADGSDMRAGLAAEAIQNLITRVQVTKGVPVSVVAPF